MDTFWRVVPAVTSALVVVVWSTFSLVLLESGGARAASNLGYEGEAVRIVAIPSGAHSGTEKITSGVVAFATERGISVAYSRGHGTGLVTLLDEHSRFTGGHGSLGELLGGVGEGPTAMVSSAVGSDVAPSHGLVVPLVTGTFESDVMFEERYPVALFNVDALPFGEGVYLFAGGAVVDGRSVEDQIAGLFEQNGMVIADLMVLDASDPRTMLLSSLRSPYGAVALMFGAVVALAQWLVLLIYTSLLRDRWLVTAVLGATRSGLRAIVLRRLMHQVAVGAASGSALSLVLVVGVEGLTLVALGPRLVVVPVAFVAGVATSLVMCWFVAARESGRVARAVPR